MRLLIIGDLGGQLSTATKIAFDRGAQVSHAPFAGHRTGRAAVRSRR